MKLVTEEPNLKLAGQNVRFDQERLNSFVFDARRGDKLAFEKLVSSTQNLARRIALSLVSPCSVDDVLQDSYLLVYRKISSLGAPEAFLSWFCKIVLRTCYDHLQKNSRVVDEEFSEKRPDHSDIVVEQIALRNALSRLHKKDRDVLILREVLELSYQEVAVALGIPVGTVRSRLSKARKHLAERLKL